MNRWTSAVVSSLTNDETSPRCTSRKNARWPTSVGRPACQSETSVGDVMLPTESSGVTAGHWCNRRTRHTDGGARALRAMRTVRPTEKVDRRRDFSENQTATSGPAWEIPITVWRSQLRRRSLQVRRRLSYLKACCHCHLPAMSLPIALPYCHTAASLGQWQCRVAVGGDSRMPLTALTARVSWRCGTEEARRQWPSGVHRTSEIRDSVGHSRPTQPR
jgi:hypothetical protein